MMKHKTKTKALNWLLSLALALGLLPAMAQTARAAASVSYIDGSGATQSITDYTVVTDSTTTWNAGWYVVNSNVAITGRITCSGDVNLILCDNASLTVTNSDTVQGSAIRWEENTGNFTIYAQSTGNDMGSLTAIHSYASNGFGICVDHGSLTINGGNVTARGGLVGIWVQNNITINGGIVNAAANISSYGSILSRWGNIAIRGGTVNATGGNYGIEPFGDSNYVLIEGGTVTASGDTGAFRRNVKNTIAGTGWTDKAGTQGEAAIAASAGGQSLSSYKKVQFLTPVTGVTLDQATLALTVGGETATLTATVSPDGATDKTVAWSSSDETVATVSDGVVTPVAAGTATITVTTTNGGFTATCAVTVAPVYTVTLTGGANASADGAKVQNIVGAMATVTFTPDDGYHFNSFDAITENGVTAEFDEGSVVVSGTPTDDATLTIPDAVANAVPFVPTFRTQSLVLSGQIGVNFFMDLSGLTEEQRDASYVEFTVSGKGGTTTTDGFDAGHTSKNGLYYGFTCYVNSIQMADTITAVYHYNDGEDQYVQKTYSVKAYLEAIQGLTQNEKMRSLAVAMGDYGYYAQQYLSQLRSFTLGVDYTAMPEGTAYTEFDIMAATNAVDEYTVNYDLDETGIEKLNYSLLLDSSTGIYIYLTPSAGYTGEVVAVIGDGEDNVAERQSDGRWRVHIANISTHQLGEPYIVNVMTDIGAFAITISALSYARTMLNYDDGTAKEQRDNAMVSLYRFYDSAMDYAGRAH